MLSADNNVNYISQLYIPVTIITMNSLLSKKLVYKKVLFQSYILQSNILQMETTITTQSKRNQWNLAWYMISKQEVI